MRIPLIAGNWKLNKDPKQTAEFVQAIKGKLPESTKVETLICATAVDLQSLVENAKGSQLHVGAENCYFENEGAYTGETSPMVLHEMGIQYVIIGHSERRQYFHETDEEINKKAKAIFASEMTPILCCGETLETREAGKAQQWVEGQIKADLAGLTADQVANMVIAYEPIWAIGTGKTATADQAEEMCAAIRKKVAALYDETVADKVRIQYGGSVKPANVKEIMSKPDIDGGLIGGAALQPDSFLQLAHFED